jgi:hypothetical protein
MKALKHLAAACVVLTMLSSCSVINKAAQAASIGSTTGNSLANIINVLKATGVIDLSNLANIINLGQILTGASTLSNATQAFTDDFATGLIKGSSNLVNSSNVTGVMSALKSLAGIDNSSILNAVTAVNAGQTPQLTSSSAGVGETLSTIQSIYNLVK